MPFDTPEGRSVEMSMMISSLSASPERAIRMIFPPGDCLPEPLKEEALSRSPSIPSGDSTAVRAFLGERWNVKFGSQGF
jgi:hypothetical protein